MKSRFILILVPILIGIGLSCNRDKLPQDSSYHTPLDSLNALIAENNSNASLYLERAGYFINNQRVEDAILDLKKVLELDSGNAKAYVLLSKAFVMIGKPQQALESLNEAGNINPDDPVVYLEKAKLYLIMKDYENCAISVEKLLDLDPQNADAFYIKGVALDENGESVKAIEAFRMAVRYKPLHYDALMQLGYAFTPTDQQLAIDYFTVAIKADSSSLEALYNLGMLLQENDKPEKALETYQRMLRLDPANKLAHFNTGYVNMVYVKDFPLAIESFSKAIALDTAFADAYYNRGYSSELSGDYGSARNDYERVLQIRPEDDKTRMALRRIRNSK